MAKTRLDLDLPSQACHFGLVYTTLTQVVHMVISYTQEHVVITEWSMRHVQCHAAG